MATESNVELRFNGKFNSLHAARDFRQGEVILPIANTVDTINYSSEPNVMIRNGRLVAFQCIQAGTELSLFYPR